MLLFVDLLIFFSLMLVLMLVFFVVAFYSRPCSRSLSVTEHARVVKLISPWIR